MNLTPSTIRYIKSKIQEDLVRLVRSSIAQIESGLQPGQEEKIINQFILLSPIAEDIGIDNQHFIGMLIEVSWNSWTILRPILGPYLE